MNEVIIKSGQTTAKISLQGASIISWRHRNRENIFTSKKAIFDQPLKAIRGGIPICFPNVGPWSGDRPQHGFARILPWEVVAKTENSATFGLKNNEYTEKIWPYKFELTYFVRMEDGKLETNLEIKNEDEKSFEFTVLFHNYLRVDDVRKAKIHGLENVEYRCGLTKKVFKERNSITVDKNVERVYPRSSSVQKLKCKGSEVLIEKFGLSDSVIWNPWEQKTAAMSDMDDNEYLEMIGVESGQMDTPIKLSPKTSYICGQIFSSN